MRIVPQTAKLVWITPNALDAIEFGARICYKSEPSHDPTRTPEFINRIVKQNHHESVVEHAVACFDLVTDRGVTHELVRHRLASYSQESTRYCNYGKDKFGNEISVIQPYGLNEEQLSTWTKAMHDAEASYLYMLECGAPPQLARSVLPTCLKTEIRMTANFREWMHVIKLRTAKGAHPQIQDLINQVKIILIEQCPIIFG